jgi:hypothetical protein
MPLVTQAEYAILRGCSEAAVSTARKDGRIKAAEVIQSGKLMIDSDKADELWARNTKRRRGGPPPKASPRPTKELEAQISMPTDQQLLALVKSLPEDAIPSIIESEARKEHYLAEKHKIAALQARNEVGSIDAMKREAFALAKAVREGVLSVIPRVSADLAALSDPFEIERLLEDEMLTALRALANG